MKMNIVLRGNHSFIRLNIDVYSGFSEFYVKRGVCTYKWTWYQLVLQSLRIYMSEVPELIFCPYSFISYKMFSVSSSLFIYPYVLYTRFYVFLTVNEGKSMFMHQRWCVLWHLIGLSDPMWFSLRVWIVTRVHLKCIY